MVSFYANPEKYDNNITIDSMDLKIRRTIELGNMLQDLQNKVLLSSAYLNKVSFPFLSFPFLSFPFLSFPFPLFFVLSVFRSWKFFCSSNLGLPQKKKKKTVTKERKEERRKKKEKKRKRKGKERKGKERKGNLI